MLAFCRRYVFSDSLALNVIHHNGPSKDSLRIRKLRASPNDDYRFELIFGKPST